MGGAATSGEALASATTGNGGIGGNGGNASGADAGTFNASNTLSSSLSNSAGIVTVAQNTGANALIQQGTTVQANLSIQ
jgi:hypothetical protein